MVHSVELIDAPGLDVFFIVVNFHIQKKSFCKKMFKVGQLIECKITEIDKEKQRISLSYKQTMENPWKNLKKTPSWK